MGLIQEKARSRSYLAQTIADTDYADDLVLLANTPAQAKSQLHSLEKAAGGIGLHDKTEYMCFILTGGPLKLVDIFTYFRSSFSSTENHINMQLVKAWSAINRLLVIWKLDQSNKIQCDFFRTVVESILLYGCNIWMLTKCKEKKLDGNCTRMLLAIYIYY